MSTKNHAFLALIFIAICSCQKVTDVSKRPEQSASPEFKDLPKVQNLGHVFTGTNVAWKIHPTGGGMAPLFMYQPNMNTGYNLLMIDGGKLNGYTPTTPIQFVSVNLFTKTSKVIKVVSKETGVPVQNSLGRVTRTIFGMNKKFYVATEGSYGGGGHVIEYDPDTEKAYDLGKPFKTGNRYLDVYTFGIGSDNALYGGSFGGNGDVMTFRYDYSNWQVDQQLIDNDMRYVLSVTGDSRYTYAACGENGFKVIAIDRVTKQKQTLLTGTERFWTSGKTDGAYTYINNSNVYKLNGFTAPVALSQHTSTLLVNYMPYQPDAPGAPTVDWNRNSKQLKYTFPSGEQGVISVNGIYEDTYETGLLHYANNNVYISGGKPSSLAIYNNDGKANVLGSFPFNVYCMANGKPNSIDANKVYFSGYPKGNLYSYNLNDSWSLPNAGVTGGSGGNAVSTNPASIALMQNPDAAGTYGPMTSGGVSYTNQGYVVVAGNNDRITGSGSRELSIGNYKNGTVKNFYISEFANYEFHNMCLSADSNYVFISAIAKSGGHGKIFKYNPTTNTVVDSWVMPELQGFDGFITSFTSDLLVVTYKEVIFICDTRLKQIAYQKVIGPGQTITAITKAPDGSFYIASRYMQANNSKIQKVQIDNSNPSAINATYTYVAEVKDEDGAESQPRNLLITPAGHNQYNIYVAGLQSLYRINNVKP